MGFFIPEPTGTNVDGLLYRGWTDSVLTFSFPDTIDFYQDNPETGPYEDSFLPFSAAQSDAMRQIISMVESFTLLDFQEVEESATTHATIRFGQFEDLDQQYLAFPPGDGAEGGDVFFKPSVVSEPEIGSFAFLHAMAGFAIALGLKEPASDELYGPLADIFDSLASTVLSKHTSPFYQGYYALEGHFPQTFMPFDIAALQNLYGANYEYNSTSTVYTWSPETGETFINGVGQGEPVENVIYVSIWDGGGIDTYDFSNYTDGIRVHLSPGEGSYLALYTGFQGPVFNPGLNEHGASILNSLLYHDNPASLIENAIGTPGQDFIEGNQANNLILGGAGNDDIFGLEGNDRLFGESGDDFLYGDDGDDVLYGGEGLNDLRGGAGDDRMVGGPSYDYLVGGNGNDQIAGGALDDVIYGSNGDDRLVGAAGEDFLLGGDGRDTIIGNLGNDEMYGGSGDDKLVGAAGNDMLYGDEGNDSLNGGRDHDFLSGGAGDDVLNGLAGEDTLHGGTGDDSLIGRAGNDLLYGEAGDDRLVGDGGHDFLNGGIGGKDRIIGGLGTDTYYIEGDAADFSYVVINGGIRIYNANDAGDVDVLLGVEYVEFETGATWDIRGLGAADSDKMADPGGADAGVTLVDAPDDTDAGFFG